MSDPVTTRALPRRRARAHRRRRHAAGPHGPPTRTGVLEQCVDPREPAVDHRAGATTRASDAERFVGEIGAGGLGGRASWVFAVEARRRRAGRRGSAARSSCATRAARRAEIAYGAHPWARGRGPHAPRARAAARPGGSRSVGLRTVIWWANRGNWASPAYGLAARLQPATAPSRRGCRSAASCSTPGSACCTRTTSGHRATPWLDLPRPGGRRCRARARSATRTPRGSSRRAATSAPGTGCGGLPDAVHRPRTPRTTSRHAVEQRATGSGVGWAVADPDTTSCSASIALFDLKPGRDAEIGYWTHPDARGRGRDDRGLRTRGAARVRPGRADGGLGLVRVQISAADGNDASRHVIEPTASCRRAGSGGRCGCGDGSLVDALVLRPAGRGVRRDGLAALSGRPVEPSAVRASASSSRARPRHGGDAATLDEHAEPKTSRPASARPAPSRLGAR